MTLGDDGEWGAGKSLPAWCAPKRSSPHRRALRDKGPRASVSCGAELKRLSAACCPNLRTEKSPMHEAEVKAVTLGARNRQKPVVLPLATKRIQ